MAKKHRANRAVKSEEMAAETAQSTGVPRFRVDLPWDPAKVFLWLFAVEVAVLVADLAAFHLVADEKARWLVDLTLEANIPTWVSTTQEFFVGVAAFLVSTHYGKQGQRFPRFAWLAIAAFFVLITVDDASEMHERVATLWNTAMRHSDGTSWYKRLEAQFSSYHWQFFFMPFFGACGIAMAAFLWRELGGMKGWLFYAGLAFYANAVLLDYFDPFFEIYVAMGAALSVRPEALQHYFRDAEEFIELFGTTCMLVAFFDHYVSLTARRAAALAN